MTRASTPEQDGVANPEVVYNTRHYLVPKAIATSVVNVLDTLSEVQLLAGSVTRFTGFVLHGAESGIKLLTYFQVLYFVLCVVLWPLLSTAMASTRESSGFCI